MMRVPCLPAPSLWSGTDLVMAPTTTRNAGALDVCDGVATDRYRRINTDIPTDTDRPIPTDQYRQTVTGRYRPTNIDRSIPAAIDRPIRPTDTDPTDTDRTIPNG